MTLPQWITSGRNPDSPFIFEIARGLQIAAGIVAATSILSAQAIRPQADSRHSGALDHTGFVCTWGENCEGQLGDGTQVDRSTPRKVLKGQYSGTAYIGDNPGDPMIGVNAGPALFELLDA